MKKQKTRPTAVECAAALSRRRDLTDTELLDRYLSLTTKEREEQFADTERAAEAIGLSRRTIQFWIGIGLLQAVRVGRKKYRVSLESLRQCLQA